MKGGAKANRLFLGLETGSRGALMVQKEKKPNDTVSLFVWVDQQARSTELPNSNIPGHRLCHHIHLYLSISTYTFLGAFAVTLLASAPASVLPSCTFTAMFPYSTTGPPDRSATPSSSRRVHVGVAAGPRNLIRGGGVWWKSCWWKNPGRTHKRSTTGGAVALDCY